MEPKIKIAIVVSHPIQHFCPQYVSFAKLLFCEVKIFFGSAMGYKKYYDTSFGKEIAWDNLKLDQFNHFFLNDDQVLPADKNLDAPNLEKELESYAPGIVITYGYFQQLQQRAQAWAKKNKIPLAFISDSERKRKRPFLTELIKKVYVRQQFKNINYFLSVGDANEDYYKYYGVKDRQIIRNPFPIDVDLFEEIYAAKEENSSRLRKEYNIKNDAIVISVVGKIESFKRQQDIIAALKLMKPEEKSIVLMVIGTGANEIGLRELSKDIKNCKVVFTGFILPEKLALYYSATDIYVHPSEKDAHSLSISEAVYMGCPVVISNNCGSYGANDDVQEGKNGFVYETGNIKELSMILDYLIRDNKILDEFGSFSRIIGLHNQFVSHHKGVQSLVERVQLSSYLDHEFKKII